MPYIHGDCAAVESSEPQTHTRAEQDELVVAAYKETFRNFIPTNTAPQVPKISQIKAVLTVEIYNSVKHLTGNLSLAEVNIVSGITTTL